MIYIDATTGTTVVTTAATDIDAAELESIVERYDHARTAEEKNTILTQAFNLVGGQVTQMVFHAAKGRLHDADMARNYAMQALHSGLENSGKVAFTARSANWEYAIEKSMRNQGGIPAEIWKRLSPSVRQAVQDRPQYIARPQIEGFVSELNNFIRDPEFVAMLAPLAPLQPDARSMAANINSLPASGLTELGAKLIQAAFPEAAVTIPERRGKLWGYIKWFVLPRMMAQVWQEAGSKLSRYDLEVWNFLKPYVNQLDELEATGKLPAEMESGGSRAEKVYFLYRRGLDRIQPSLRWYEAAIGKYGNPFRVNSPESLRDARQLLLEHGVAEATLPKVPVRMLKPISLSKVEEILGLAEGKPQAPQKPTPPMATQPNRGGETQAEDAAQKWLSRGHASPAYSWMIDCLYERGSIENEVGNFLARNPSPSRPMIADFTQSLSEQNESDLEYAGGFQAVALAIDKEVLRQIPAMRPELEKVFTPQTINAALDSMHRGVLLFKYAAYSQRSMLKSA